MYSNCHNYIPGYERLFKSRRYAVKNLLEIGIGSVENGQMSGVLHLGYKTGNSLRCWRDYFPCANIYGIDIFETKIKEERITTFVANQSDVNELNNVVEEINSDLDIIIDDGSHNGEHQKFSFMFLEKKLSKNGIYIIEDIQPQYIDKFVSLSIFPENFKNYVKDTYIIEYFDTREILNRQDDFMMAFIKK